MLYLRTGNQATKQRRCAGAGPTPAWVVELGMSTVSSVLAVDEKPVHRHRKPSLISAGWAYIAALHGGLSSWVGGTRTFPSRLKVSPYLPHRPHDAFKGAATGAACGAKALHAVSRKIAISSYSIHTGLRERPKSSDRTATYQLERMNPPTLVRSGRMRVTLKTLHKPSALWRCRQRTVRRPYRLPWTAPRTTLRA